MADLVPLQVKVFRRSADLDSKRKAGQADIPPFNEIPEDIRHGLPWSQYIDQYGSGWIGRDQVENLGLKNRDHGMWLALVPEDFANEAVARWPHLCRILSDTQAATFYETRCALDEPDMEYDDAELDRIYKLHVLEQAGVAPPPSQQEQQRRQRALDPSHPSRGVRPNNRKSWTGIKGEHSFTVKPGVTPTTFRQPPPGWQPGRGQ